MPRRMNAKPLFGLTRQKGRRRRVAIVTRVHRLTAKTRRSTRRRAVRGARPYRMRLHLELLEERTLFSVGALYVAHPELMLHPLREGPAPRSQPVTIGTGGAHDDQGPLDGEFPNILVNDPAEDGNSPQDTHS